ncbi:protein kinase, partial [Pyxidicoccus fallax]
VSLYEWALRQRPTSRQVLRVLASLARALEATHAAGGVHRDFKGDNVLVREGDDWPFLIDFGAGHFLGASTLTEPPFPPGTPPYRSPEAWRSVRLPLQPPAIPYAPTAADDVFALGVTAWRLVTDEYPSSPEPALHVPSLDEGAALFPRARNPRCLEELSDLTARMFSPTPEVRGTARELAEALEHAALGAEPEAYVPLYAPLAPAAPTRTVPHRRFSRAVRSRLAAASLGATLAMGTAWMLSAHPGAEAGKEHASNSEEAEDGGTIAIGDTALTAPLPPTQAPFAWSAISVDLPPRPFPGQRRPDANGRCPSRKHFSINGGCWLKAAMDLKDCEAEGYYIYKGGCYVPVMPPPRAPTANPVSRPEDTSE